VAVALLLLALYAWPRARRGAESPDVLFARGRSAFDAREFARALPDLEAAARQGHREARYLTGELYGGGFDGVERADDRGRPWLMLAADSGHAGAMYELGERYSTGDGVARNYTSAVGWYRRAADLGHAEAQRSLGNNYITGVGIPTGPDTAEAARWYGRAADGGDAEAAFRLATLHEQGHGVARDLPRALTLYRQAIPRRTDAAGAVERVERAIARGER
jgi:TPR repeat protein